MDGNPVATEVKIGDAVRVVGENYGEHIALVTAVHGKFGGEYVPSINVVFVSDDPGQTDPYGRQTARLTSLAHYSTGPNKMPRPGRYWINL